MNVLVTGQPGVGKTTLIMKVVDKLKSAHPDKKFRGFYTEEVRSGGERVGFDVVTVHGRRGPLARTAGLVSPRHAGSDTWRQQPSSQTTRGAEGAHGASYGRGKSDSSSGRTKPPAMVGKYAVHVASFEPLMLPELEWKSGQPKPDLVVIDEVGKMELFSKKFWPAVCHVLDSPVPVLGSVPVPRYGRDIAEVELVRKRADVEIITLTRDNRERMVERVCSKLHAALSLLSTSSSSSSSSSSSPSPPPS